MCSKVLAGVVCVSCAIALCSVALGAAIDEEKGPVIERAKSADAAERRGAVIELLGIRQGVSEALKAIVADGDAGRAGGDAKARALVLMGELGLVDCKDVLKAHEEWQWSPPFPAGREIPSPFPAQFGLGRGGFADALSPQPVSSVSLSAYPVLAAALSDLRDEARAVDAQIAMTKWYRSVIGGFESVLYAWKPPLYSDDVRVTAIYLLGEYRVQSPQPLRDGLGMEDTTGLTATYPSMHKITSPDPTFPAAVALAKCGGRFSAHTVVNQIEAGWLSDDAIGRFVRACAVCNAKALREALAYKVSVQKDSQVLSRLSVATKALPQ